MRKRILIAGLLSCSMATAQGPKSEEPPIPPAKVQELPDPKQLPTPVPGTTLPTPPPGEMLFAPIPAATIVSGPPKLPAVYGYYSTQWRSFPGHGPIMGPGPVIESPMSEVVAKNRITPKTPLLPPTGTPVSSSSGVPVATTEVAQRQMFVLPPPTVKVDTPPPLQTMTSPASTKVPISTEKVILPPIVPPSMEDRAPPVPKSVQEIAGPQPKLATLGRPVASDPSSNIRPTSFESTAPRTETPTAKVPLPVIINGNRK